MTPSMFSGTHCTYNTLPITHIITSMIIFYVYTSLYTPPRHSPDSHSF